MPARFQHDVFLSHNRAQKDWTRDLAQRLEKSNFKVWFDEWSLRGGDVGSIAMERGIEESRHVVLVLSPEFIKAEWTDYETQIAILLDPANRSRKLIPILHTKCDVPSRLKRLVWVDFTDTHGNPERYEFRLAQLISDLEPNRFKRPTNFETFRAGRNRGESDVIPSIRALPRGSRMPHAPNAQFVGREEEMRTLERMLTPGSSTAVGVHAAVSGMGGVGKTQLAIEYAHRYGDRYSAGVFWLSFAKEEEIITEVAACGGHEAESVPGWNTMKPPERAEIVQRIWQESEDARLLIFDNAEDPAQVERWRPKSGCCSMLITCRLDKLPAKMGVKPLPIETLPREKSLELLAEARHEIIAASNSKERGAADKICELLGDLPLALTVAAAYLGKYRNDSLGEYLQALSSQPAIEDSSLKKEVAASFVLSFNRLDPKKPVDVLAQKLFYLAAFFAPVSINRALLAASAGLKYIKIEDRHQADDAMARLLELALIKQEPDGRLLLHRLLREFAQQNPPQGLEREAAIQAVGESLFDFGVQENQSGLPQALARERVHLRHIALEVQALNPDLAGRLLNELGRNGRTLALFDEAKADYENAIKLGEAVHGSDHPWVAPYLNNLGLVFQELGDLAGARANFERALKIGEAVYGPDHPDVATDVNNLGAVLKQLGDLAGARANFERALKIDEATYGPDHPDVAIDVNNLGDVLQDLGDLAGARANYERALKIDEATYGSDHPNVAIRLNNLGDVLQDLGDLPGARANFERALTILETTYGPDHPNVAIGVNNLGSVLQALGDLEGAHANYERALKIDEAVYGADHPSVAIRLNNLGLVLKDLGDLAGARANFERALNIFKKVLGNEHPNTRLVQRHLDSLGKK